MNKVCPMCNKRPVPPGCYTCCNSYCQEAGYYESMVHRFRKGSAARGEAVMAYQRKKAVAEEMVR